MVFLDCSCIQTIMVSIELIHDGDIHFCLLHWHACDALWFGCRTIFMSCALLEADTFLLSTTLSLFSSCLTISLFTTVQRSVIYQGQVHASMFNELIGRCDRISGSRLAVAGARRWHLSPAMKSIDAAHVEDRVSHACLQDGDLRGHVWRGCTTMTHQDHVRLLLEIRIGVLCRI